MDELTRERYPEFVGRRPTPPPPVEAPRDRFPRPTPQEIRRRRRILLGDPVPMSHPRDEVDDHAA